MPLRPEGPNGIGNAIAPACYRSILPRWLDEPTSYEYEIALKKLVLSKFHAGRVRLSENLLESIVLFCTVEPLQTVHAHARILSVAVFWENGVPLLGSYCSLG